MKDNIDDLINLVEIEVKTFDETDSAHWSEGDPIAKLAISVIDKIFEEKSTFIKKQTKRDNLKPAKVILIVKSDIAKSVGKSRAFLFGEKKFKYARKIREYIEQKERELKRRRDRRIESFGSNLKSKKKNEIIEIARQRKELSIQNAEALWTKFIDETPIDIKRKLGLI